MILWLKDTNTVENLVKNSKLTFLLKEHSQQCCGKNKDEVLVKNAKHSQKFGKK